MSEENFLTLTEENTNNTNVIEILKIAFKKFKEKEIEIIYTDNEIRKIIKCIKVRLLTICSNFNQIENIIDSYFEYNRDFHSMIDLFEDEMLYFIMCDLEINNKIKKIRRKNIWN